MTVFDILASSGDWTPRKWGVATGSGLIAIILLLGVIKCISIMRRPGTHKLCVIALMVALLAWLFSVMGNSAEFIPPAAGVAVRALARAVSGLIMMAALVLGVIGLATYDRQRFRQGRAQATWAVVLAGIVLIATLGVLVKAVVKSSGVVAASSPGAAGIQIRNEEFNFSLTPPAGWMRFKPGAVDKLACLALRRANPEVYCMVIGERIGREITVDQVAEITKSHLAGLSKVRRQSEERIIINGVTFARIRTKAWLEQTGMTFDYEHWVAAQRGFSWQVVFRAKDGCAALASESRDLIESFRVLDPGLDAAGKGALTDVNRPELGYRTKLEGMGWAPWTTGHKNGLRDFGASRNKEALCVVPVRLGFGTSDFQALTRGLLSTLAMQGIPDEEFGSRPWTPGYGGTGRELEVERDVEGKRYHYILRVASGKGCAHLIAGWAEVPDGNLDLVRKSLDAITLGQPQGPAPVLEPAQERALGLVFNEAGISLMNRQENEAAAHWFLEGFKHGNNPTVLGNAGEVMERAGQAAKGVEALGPYIGKFPGHHYLGLRFARLQVLGGNVDAGVGTFLGLIERGLKNEDDLLAWLQMLDRNGHHAAAARSAEAWVARHPTTTARRWQAQSYGAAGDFAKAVALLEKLRQENPGDTKVALDLGSAYNAAGEHAKAAETAANILAENKDSAPALEILGWSQMGRKWYRDAKSSFERAAAIHPKDEAFQDAIRRASAALGQGDNSTVKEPVSPVEVPKEVTAALGMKSPPADFGAGYPCAWLMRSTGYHFEKGKPARRTVHGRVKILTAEGAGEFSSVEVKFEPLAERIFMNRLEVKDEDGKTIARASLDDAYVRDFNDGTASNDKVLHMQVAGVRPGSVVEWEVTIEDRGNSDRFGFQRHLFANVLPVAAEAVFITGDVAEIGSELAQGESLRKIRTGQLMAWISGERAAVPQEALSVREEEQHPMLWIGGREGNWEMAGKDYLKKIEDRFAPDKSLEELAATLISGKAGDRDKIAAIARHVQKEISYKAIEFGVRARRPNAAADTLRLRYGDCKDTALLMHRLLCAAGITSHLALVNTVWNIQPGLPTLDQFNHMVVHVPALGPGWLLDATDKSLALALFPANNLWQSHALILDPAGPRLIPPPLPASPDSCHVTSHRTVSVKGDDWMVEERLDATGYYAGWMRGAFAGLSPTGQRDKAQNLLSEHGAAQVCEFHFENPDDVEEPVRLFMSYAVRDGVTNSGGSRNGVPPALWEHYYLGTDFVKDRKTAFRCFYPFHLTGEMVVKLPAAPSGECLAAFERQSQSPYCSWNLKPVSRGNDVALRFDFVEKTGRYPAPEYAAFHEAWEAARRAWDKTLSWKENR